MIEKTGVKEQVHYQGIIHGNSDIVLVRKHGFCMESHMHQHKSALLLDRQAQNDNF